MAQGKTAHEYGPAHCELLVLQVLTDAKSGISPHANTYVERILYFALAHTSPYAVHDMELSPDELFGLYKRWAETTPHTHEDRFTWAQFQRQIDRVLTGLGYQRTPLDPSNPKGPAYFQGPALTFDHQPDAVVQAHARQIVAFHGHRVAPPPHAARGGTALGARGHAQSPTPDFSTKPGVYDLVVDDEVEMSHARKVGLGQRM